MRIGIVADIHEAIELLEIALNRVAQEGVDQVVVLGDVFEAGPRLDEAVALLQSARAIGVYGNHDYGLCVEPSAYVRSRYSETSLAYMGSLLPRMELDGCLFAHREPWLDCSQVEQIWHVEDDSLPPEVITRSFAAVPHRSIFIGHFHRWQAFTPEGPLTWNGAEPLALPEDSATMVVVHAVLDGYAAIFDTERRVLTPIDLYEGQPRPESPPLPRFLDE